MYLYLLEREHKDKKIYGTDSIRESGHSDTLIRKALMDYCVRQNPDIPLEVLKDAVIDREEKGKPFFRGLPEISACGLAGVYFSVSHSGPYWGCLMGEEPVGFDMEICREKTNYEKIARRFFTDEEYEMVLSGGADAFFEVWVRKEAYVKFTGFGLAGGLDSFSVAAGGKLADTVLDRKSSLSGRSHCRLHSFKIAKGVKAAYCSESGNPIKATINLDTI